MRNKRHWSQLSFGRGRVCRQQARPRKGALRLSAPWRATVSRVLRRAEPSRAPPLLRQPQTQQPSHPLQTDCFFLDVLRQELKINKPTWSTVRELPGGALGTSVRCARCITGVDPVYVCVRAAIFTHDLHHVSWVTHYLLRSLLKRICILRWNATNIKREAEPLQLIEKIQNGFGRAASALFYSR